MEEQEIGQEMNEGQGMESTEAEVPETEVSDVPEVPEVHTKHVKSKPEAKLSLKIVEKRENPILDREEIIAVAHASKTPTNEEVKEALVSELKAKPELLVLKNVLTTFGKKEVKIFAYLYKSGETMQKLSIKKKLVKEGEAKAE